MLPAILNHQLYSLLFTLHSSLLINSHHDNFDLYLISDKCLVVFNRKSQHLNAVKFTATS